MFALIGVASSSIAAPLAKEQINKVVKNKNISSKIKKLSSTPPITSVGKSALAQEAHHVCAIDDNGQDWAKLQLKMKQHLKKVSLNIAQDHRTTASNARNYEDNGVAGRYYIPVVFHVYGNEFNCSDAAQACLTEEKIVDALNRTNEDFLGTNTLDGPIDPVFQAIRQNLNIEFVLAKKDPSGNATNGIVRYAEDKKGYGNGSGYNDQIAADAWDNDRYMNVFIMKDLYDDGSTNNSGVAWYPEQSMTDNNLARVVYNGLYVGSNTDENFRSVLTHEFGHWLNLPHTFAGETCSLENESFCSLTGDRSCDTPQMSLSGLYDNAPNCLGQKTNTENFMHYTSNYAMFTEDQVDRMTAALHSPMRSNLWSNANLVATGLVEYTSNSERHWDGVSGIDSAPEGDLLASHSNLSAEQGTQTSFEVNVPENTEAVGFYLSGYTEDPDMYVSLGRESTHDGQGTWDADYISFEAAGSPEFIGVLSPDSTQPYHVTVDAYSAYSNALLQAISVDDPLLAPGTKRHHVYLEKDIWSYQGKAPKEYKIQVPANAEKTVVVLAGKYGGDPDIFVNLDRAIAFSRETDDCVPFSAARFAEYCEFDRGGLVNIAIDPYAEYWESTLHVYYETTSTENQAPIAITKPKYRAIVEHEVHFKGYNSTDVDGTISSYTWDFGDGNSSTEINPIHQYTEIGDYTATLTVTDDQGVASTTSADVSITLLSPDDETLCDNCRRVYLTEEIDISAAEGETPRAYQFLVPDAASLVAIEIVEGSNGDPDLHVSRNQEVSTSIYDCRPFEGPGAAEVCHFREGGVYNVIIDTPKAYSAVTFKAYYDIPIDADNSPPNQLPIAQVTSNTYAYLNSPTQLSGENSSDPDGDIASYAWQLSDGSHYNSMSPAHSFTGLGNKVITLKVTDEEGATDSDSKEIIVLPVGDMDADGDVDKIDMQQFVLAVRKRETLDPAFDLNGDGVINSRDARSYRALCSYQNCSTVAPEPQAPIVEISSLDTVTLGESVTFNSDDSQADASDRYAYIEQYEWTFGDNQTSNQANPNFTFDTVGEYEVTLTLTNNKGLSSTAKKTIFVEFPALTPQDCAISENNTLEKNAAKCVTEEKSRYDFTIPGMNQHKTLALTVAFAEGEFQLYYENGGWPSAHSEEYDEKVIGNGSACLYINLDSDTEYWGYLQVTGDLQGATIVADFDTQDCRAISN